VLGLTSIYAPSDVDERATLWEWLVDVSLKSYWLLCDDFKKIKTREDKVRLLPACVLPRKELDWNGLKARLDLYNPGQILLQRLSWTLVHLVQFPQRQQEGVKKVRQRSLRKISSFFKMKAKGQCKS
jgi:hypothetical protein